MSATILSIIAICISTFALIFSFYKFWKYDSKIKNYELERINDEKNDKRSTNVEARIIKSTDGNYKVEVCNTGKTKAFNVEYQIPTEYKIKRIEKFTPYECLEPGDSFQETIFININASNKYKINTRWQDELNKIHEKKQTRTINI